MSASSRSPTSVAVRSTQPTTPMTKSVALGYAKELPRLAFAGDRLHEYAAVDTRALQLSCEVRRAEGAANRIERCALHPGIVVPRGIPEMVVRVDSHQCSPTSTAPVGTGASSRIKRSRRSSSQRSAGIGVSSQRKSSSSSVIDRKPISTVETRGCARGNCNAAAGKGTSNRSQTARIR